VSPPEFRFQVSGTCYRKVLYWLCPRISLHSTICNCNYNVRFRFHIFHMSYSTTTVHGDARTQTPASAPRRSPESASPSITQGKVSSLTSPVIIYPELIFPADVYCTLTRWPLPKHCSQGGDPAQISENPTVSLCTSLCPGISSVSRRQLWSYLS
jgi:hypothetical protein